MISDEQLKEWDAYVSSNDTTYWRNDLGLYPCYLVKKLIKAIRAERTYRKEYLSMFEAHGCITGDCPHENQEMCNAKIFQFVKEALAKNKEILG